VTGHDLGSELLTVILRHRVSRVGWDMEPALGNQPLVLCQLYCIWWMTIVLPPTDYLNGQKQTLTKNTVSKYLYLMLCYMFDEIVVYDVLLQQ